MIPLYFKIAIFAGFLMITGFIGYSLFDLLWGST
jgi:hypothetical protein